MDNKSYIITFPELDTKLRAADGDNLLDVIRGGGVYIDADCGGHGKCGKCVAYVDGARALACETTVRADASVFVPATAEAAGYEILTERSKSLSARSNDGNITKTDAAGSLEPDPGAEGYALAIDLGTTTIAMTLVDSESGKELGEAAALNAQRVYGADVISRIEASANDLTALSAAVTRQIEEMAENLTADCGADTTKMRRVVVAGNTTMCYLLLGLPCRSLGRAPFKPDYTLNDRYAWREIFHTDVFTADVYVIPFISAYVGGDIVAGLVSIEDSAARADNGYLLVDMGTNGEIAFRRGDTLLCTSTAAGPAFEGGNISCGSGSIRGAVSEVACRNDAFTFKTIGGAPPVSICGSGLLDAVACFVRMGLVNESGAFSDDASQVTEGSIRIATANDMPTNAERHGDARGKDVTVTQRDIREFQLAKSAIRAGIEILIDEMNGIPGKVFLSGGFGQHLNPESAFITGLLPESLRGRVIPCGNSSLTGALRAAKDIACLKAARATADAGSEINLAAHKRFNELFMMHMGFESARDYSPTASSISLMESN